LQSIFRAAAAAVPGLQHAGFEQRLDVAQRRVERAPGEFRVTRRGNFRVGAVVTYFLLHTILFHSERSKLQATPGSSSIVGGRLHSQNWILRFAQNDRVVSDVICGPPHERVF
jgi:hypothetical protein